MLDTIRRGLFLSVSKFLLLSYYKLSGPIIVESKTSTRYAINTNNGPIVYDEGTFFVFPKNLRMLKKLLKKETGIRIVDIPENYRNHRDFLLLTLRGTVILDKYFQSNEPEILKVELLEAVDDILRIVVRKCSSHR